MVKKSADTELQIRRATAGDVAALRAIECAVFDLEQLTARAFRRYIGSGGADIVVALGNGELIGYGIASYRRGSVNGRLISIAVATRASGRGIGTLLLSALHTEAVTRGMHTMRLEVRRNNFAGLGLYGRTGYTIIGEKPAYYADFCDAIVMECGLST